MTTDTFFAISDNDNGYVYSSDSDCAGGSKGSATYLDVNNTLQARIRDNYLNPNPGIDAFFIRRGYLFFDTSSLPAGSTVTKVELRICPPPGDTNINSTFIYQQNFLKSHYGDAQSLYEGIPVGSVYTSNVYAAAENIIDLGAQAKTDLQSHPTWFGVGLTANEAISNAALTQYYGSGVVNATDPLLRLLIPKLLVTYGAAGSINTNFLIMF